MGDESVTHLSIYIDEDKVIEGAQLIIKNIRPNWNHNNIQFKMFTDGITNKLVGCFNQIAGQSIEDVILIRVYGNKTDLLIDRSAETRNIMLLHRYNIAPQLFAIFNNGLVYEYVPGVTLKPSTVIQPNIFKLIANKMAKFHKVQSESKNAQPMLLTKLNKFLDLIPHKFEDSVKHERITKLFPSIDELRKEFEFLFSVLIKLDSPLVFCHNDLLLGNVIYTEVEKKVTFIDFEYADTNYQAFDIGNHFTEFAGIDEIDYKRYPSKEFQKEWLRAYLSEFKSMPENEVSYIDIELLYIQVNKFALASHFLWTIWGLIQSEHSKIDFDFISFAHIRYSEYLSKRDIFLSL